MYLNRENRNTHLTDDIFVSDPNYKPVLRGVVFIFRLEGQLLTVPVVGFTFTASPVLYLIPLKVLFIFDNFYETLEEQKK